MKKGSKEANNFTRKDFVGSFSKPYILKWSLWWALGMCGNFQARNIFSSSQNKIEMKKRSNKEKLELYVSFSTALKIQKVFAYTLIYYYLLCV
jgi:hypothetical protein